MTQFIFFCAVTFIISFSSLSLAAIYDAYRKEMQKVQIAEVNTGSVTINAHGYTKFFESREKFLEAIGYKEGEGFTK